MTKKELEELVKKQSEQISELVSLVQELKNNRNQIVIKSEPAPQQTGNRTGIAWDPTYPSWHYYSEPYDCFKNKVTC